MSTGPLPIIFDMETRDPDDVLALCLLATHPDVVTWTEVRVTYASGQWGAEAAAGTGTFISIAADAGRFFEKLVEPARPRRDPAD